MTLNPGDEFRIKATPSPELARKLAYLAAQDNESVLTGGFKASSAGPRRSDSDKARKTADALRMARLADPEYQAVSQRINNELDLMDEASVHALQEIEQELAELRRARERMLEQAYRDEEGNAIFMAADESAAFYEDGSKVADDEFAQIKNRLRGKPTWDKWQPLIRKENELTAERDQIHAHDAARKELREDLAQGAISQEEAEQRKQEIEQSLPDRAHRSYEALASKPQTDPNDDTGLSAEEAAALTVRSESSPDASKASSDSAGTPSAAAPYVSGTAYFHPR